MRPIGEAANRVLQALLDQRNGKPAPSNPPQENAA